MARPVWLIAVPYDSAHCGERMGAGPLDLLANGAAERAAADGADVTVVQVEAASPWRAEVATAFELNRTLAERVAAASRAGAFPLVLAGNCVCAAGTVAGLQAAEGDPLGVLWLDAHADLNTPETSTSGFLDGMALAILTGACWRGMADSIPGFQPIVPEHVMLVGARDLDPAEGAALAGSRIRRVTVAEAAGGGMAEALEALRDAGVRRLYLHVDLDVHDPSACRANAFAALEGLLPEQVRAVIARAADVVPISAAAVTAYDPVYGGRDVALALVASLAGLAAPGPLRA